MKKQTKSTRVTGKKKALRKPEVTAGWEARFIAALREWPNVTRAAAQIGVSRWEVYRTRQQNKEFALMFEEARRLGIEALEDTAIDQTRTNPTLMIFMLKNLKPEVYSDRHVVETWQDRVIALLRERKVTIQDVTSEFGSDIATELALAAGLSSGESSQT